MRRCRVGTVLVVGLLCGAAQAQTLPPTVGVLWAGPSGDVAGTVILACVDGSPVCAPSSRAQRVNGLGRYAVYTWTRPQTQPTLFLAWRDVNADRQINAGDELAQLDGADPLKGRLSRYDGNWKAWLGAKRLDDLYQSETLGAVPPQGPMPVLAQIPLTSGPVQPSTEQARGSFGGSWLLIGAYPTPLPPGRDWSSPATLKQDAAWPLQNVGFQDRFKGRYLRAADLDTLPAGCQPGSQASLKLEGQFDTAGGVLSFRDTGKTITSRCQRPPAAGAVSAGVKAQCQTLVANLPAAQRAATYAGCLTALSNEDTPQAVQKLKLETHRYTYRRYDLRLSSDERDGNNYLLFLEDERGNVYLYRKS